MTGNSGAPSLLQRQPVVAAVSLTAAVTAILAAFWSVSSDAGWFPWLSQGSIAYINGAIIVGTTLLTGWYAQRHSTPTAAPKIAEGTTVVTTNAATGVTTGTVSV